MEYRSVPLKKYVILCVVIVILLQCLSQETDEEPKRQFGFPTITNTYLPLEYCSIDQIISDDRYLYILFGEHKGNIQVFDLDGEYQYSAYFYCHLNGAFAIAVSDGVLYVRDEHRNIYALRDGQFIAFYKKEDAGVLLNSLDFTTQADEYKVKKGSVWRHLDGEESCIIERPWISALYQGDFIFILSFGSVLLIGVINLKNKKVKPQ